MIEIDYIKRIYNTPTVKPNLERKILLGIVLVCALIISYVIISHTFSSPVLPRSSAPFSSAPVSISESFLHHLHEGTERYDMEPLDLRVYTVDSEEVKCSHVAMNEDHIGFYTGARIIHQQTRRQGISTPISCKTNKWVPHKVAGSIQVGNEASDVIVNLLECSEDEETLCVFSQEEMRQELFRVPETRRRWAK